MNCPPALEGGGHQVQGSLLSERGKLEHPPERADWGDSDGIRRPESDGEALKMVQTTWNLLPRRNHAGFLEHSPCQHPLVGKLVSMMDLGDVVPGRVLGGVWPPALLGSGTGSVPMSLGAGRNWPGVSGAGRAAGKRWVVFEKISNVRYRRKQRYVRKCHLYRWLGL